MSDIWNESSTSNFSFFYQKAHFFAITLYISFSENSNPLEKKQKQQKSTNKSYIYTYILFEKEYLHLLCSSYYCI